MARGDWQKRVIELGHVVSSGGLEGANFEVVPQEPGKEAFVFKVTVETKKGEITRHEVTLTLEETNELYLLFTRWYNWQNDGKAK